MKNEDELFGLADSFSAFLVDGKTVDKACIEQCVERAFQDVSADMESIRDDDGFPAIAKSEDAWELIFKDKYYGAKFIDTFLQYLSGRISIQSVAPTLFVPPGRELRGAAEFEELLGEYAKDYVTVWDPYVSWKTLHFIEALPANVQFWILTCKVEEKKRLTDSLVALRQRGYKVRLTILKLLNGKHPLHDRLIFTKTVGWILGPSIKDIGTKPAAISPLTGEAKIELENQFLELLNQEHSLPAPRIMTEEL